MVEGKLQRKGIKKFVKQRQSHDIVQHKKGLHKKEKTKENRATKEHPPKQHGSCPNSRVMVAQKGRPLCAKCDLNGRQMHHHVLFKCAIWLSEKEACRSA